jgi:hypothetical protein
MPCENYREALIEAAAADSAPSLELRSHLDTCASCRAAFTEELQLFAAIDTRVRATANAEVPHSFLPHVIAGLEDISAPQRRWTSFLIFAAASAAIVLTVFIATRPRHAINDTQATQILSEPPNEKPETSAQGEASKTPAIMAANGLHQTLQRRNSASPSFAPSTQLQVLVPPEEREAFARFISLQQRRTEVVIAVVAPAPDDKDMLLSVKSLEIAELEVTPLESLTSEVPDGKQEKQ